MRAWFGILVLVLAFVGEASGCPDDAVQALDGCLICTTAGSLCATVKSPDVPRADLDLQPPFDLLPDAAFQATSFHAVCYDDCLHPPRLLSCVLLI
jgi:hypothetical protein